MDLGVIYFNYEKDIKRNFSKMVQEKLILNLIKISDN